MPIFRDFFGEMFPLVPTVLRRTAANILNLQQEVLAKANDAIAEALSQYIETSWPLATASTWLLDEHWGPSVDLKRNGLNDADYRLFIRAKRLLNRSWGAADQALQLFHLLLPTAGLAWNYFPPKAWTVNITGVSMATAAPAILFMTKLPSPGGRGFSVAGDNGIAIVADAEAFNYSSVYGVIGVDYLVTGWFGSVHGAGGGTQAGYAHAAQI